ncbi:biopolymer transporter ExbD [Colwellia sp. E2M01]|uniref:ExbD/TolR family protein n=1 Tax=Colwellia sp. E2M01 TaxID=2841561 RepID=UPI001C08B9F5|nr:biopolymer transporter ExbD [Colwellia sp. E2M01]MBU2872190.1 biopolymer transporter ExbD [Colwellia sp. E2M01]
MQFNDTEEELVENHDINVTPFIDVMLVLLIIFMVVAPLATITVPIELPTSNKEASELPPPNPVVVTITKEGSYVMAENTISLENLASEIKQAVAQQDEELVYIQADKSINYEQLMTLMNLIRSQGIANIGLVAEPEKALSES